MRVCLKATGPNGDTIKASLLPTAQLPDDAQVIVVATPTMDAAQLPADVRAYLDYVDTQLHARSAPRRVSCVRPRSLRARRAGGRPRGRRARRASRAGPDGELPRPRAVAP